ncbi:hypothetical protein I3J13_09065 [Agrobacterium sp. MOPV5]|uniref:glycine-rich domain-containing protein n=1 Tax=Agrobacterium leguminum TaxID=2792015 RepID=UPI0018C33B81|nr:hypothetical protein [Agrobacterium leguminum]MBG0508913.1 hypothetical protein [Agrobacterium leguminum]
MKYHPPYGSIDPNASYVDKDVPGAVRGSAIPAKAVEVPQREIVNVISKTGKEPADGNQLASAIQSGKLNFSAIGGAANALTMTLPEAPASWSDLIGTPLRGTITTTNTGACTLNVNGLGAKSIKIDNGSDPLGGDLKTGAVVVFVYDGTNVQVTFASAMLTERLNKGSTIVSYGAAGSFSWNPPANVRSVFVRVWGGGAGGGGNQNTGAGGGGGGGGYAEGYVAVTPGTPVTVVVGAGGAGGLNSTAQNGVAGGSSSFGPSVSASGGTGGAGALNGTQGASGGGGTGVGGQRQAMGGQGSSGSWVFNASYGIGGSGGAAAAGGGPGGGISSGLPASGQAPGGGGGGGAMNFSGGAGAAGLVTIEYFAG